MTASVGWHPQRRSLPSLLARGTRANKHTNSDWHEPAQLNHQPNDMIQIEHSRISEAYPAEKAVVQLPSIVAWAGFFGIVRGLTDRLQEGLT